MKRILNSIAVLALVVTGAVSCQKELSGPAGQEGQEVAVSLDLTTGQIGTRAYADGQSVDVVHVHVYQKDGSGNLTYIAPAEASATVQNPSKDVTMNAGRASYSTRLVTGQTYTFVFWAEKKDCGHYSYNPNTQTVTVNYANAAGNDESRDAFYAVLPNVEITGAYSKSVTLNRPFAQINFGVTAEDLNAAALAGVTVNGAAVKLTGIANSINLLDGSVSGSETVSFANADLPSETFSAAGVTYNYVAMDYVLVGKDTKTLSDVTLTLDVTGTTSAATEYTYPNVPLQGNYRTNIVGNLFTSPADIDINVDSGFSTPDNDIVINAATIADANAALAAGATSVKIAKVTASEASTTTLTMPATSESISIEIENIESSANLQIVAPGSGSNPESVSVNIPSTATVENLTINLPKSHVEVNGASYTNITATTSNNTLVIGKDATVENLDIKAGSVEIYGTVTELTKETSAGPVTYYVDDEAKLKKAFTIADRIVVKKDIDMVSSAIINGGRTLEIDLNGHNISAPSKVLNISNAKVDFIGKGKIYESTDDQYGALLIAGSSEDVSDYTVVNVGENVTLAGWSGIFIAKDAAGGYKNYGIVVNCKGSLENPGMDTHSTPGHAIYINGSNIKTTGNIPKINLDGCRLKSKGLGIYAAGYAEWTLSNCEVEGDETAIEIRAGKMTVNGGTYTSNAESFEVERNGNGNSISGAALGISQHSTDLPIDVVVHGGTFTGEYAIYEEDVQNETARDQIKLTVNDGTFNGAIYSQNNPNAIVKGTYSDPSVLHYLAEGADVKIEMTADNEIASEVSVSQKAEINLNDHKLKVSAYFSTIGSGSLAISNGSIECVDPSRNGTNPQIRSYGSSLMSFDDVEMTSNGSAVYVGEECNFTIKNSTIEANTFGISTNASDSSQNPTINVDNCTITGSDPILVNIPCSLTVKASELKGTMHGTVVRGGTATFTDCQISLNYPDNDANDMANYFVSRNWGQGNMVNLAAMTIGNKHTTSYQYPTNVSLVNTAVKVEGEYASCFPALYAYANSGEGLGLTLTYDENCTFTGGTGMSYGSTNIVVNGTAVNAE